MKIVKRIVGGILILSVIFLLVVRCYEGREVKNKIEKI